MDKVKIQPAIKLIENMINSVWRGGGGGRSAWRQLWR